MTTERLILSRRLYEGHVISLREDTVEMPGGKQAKREVVEHRGAVVIVPLDGEGNVLMVRQYRHAAGQTLLELPAGTLNPKEFADDCAARELQEETGHIGKLKRLGGFYSAPGFCSEFLHLYLATELRPSFLKPDEDERLELVRVPFERAIELVRRGEVKDAKSVAGLLLARDLGLK